MYQKVGIFIFFGLLCSSCGTRMKYERGFPEAIYRGESNMMPETVYKKEPMYQRETILQSEPVMPRQIMRGGAIFASGEAIAVKPVVLAQEQYVPRQQPIANEQMLPAEQYIRSEPIMRGETFFRTEPVIHRETMVRSQPVMRAEPVYQSNLREPFLYTNEPRPYTVTVTPCSCSACSECSSCSSCSACSQPQSYSPLQSSELQDDYYSVPRQSIIAEPTVVSQQPIVTQQYLPQRITYQNRATAIMKPTFFHSYIPMPRIQRFVHKSYRPVTDKVQITTVPIQSAQEMSGFQVPASESVSFSNNMSSYQNQAPVQDHTPEPQTTPVTSRSSSNRFPIPPVSSIC